MIMSPLIAFLIVFVLLLIALIKLKVTPSVGLFAAAIIFGLMVGMPAADILSKLPAGFGNMMTPSNLFEFQIWFEVDDSCAAKVSGEGLL